MTSTEDRARSVFLAALEREPDQWPAFLDEACAGDAALRARVEQLLRTHDAMGSIHVGGVAAAGLTAAGADQPAPAGPHTTIGRYKLLETLGEGGYGTVFMAEQTSPVRRMVALKIIKAGMDTRQVIARFEAERQALALMDHPNIAKVFDAGVTEAGRPYFVMELVKGVPITHYCDEHRLAPRERLALFVQVCHGVQHAHQKGIIHRDLKPTNVLVALYDGVPVPKVIDFGVAKATGQRLTERTMFTGFGDVIGTPQYMSPEQAELNQLDVDTRSDIYSLGVLLYELLTGTTPLEHKRAKEAALLEVLRLIREEEPPKPSTRLTTLDKLAAVAAQRGLEPRKLASLIRGELDWIVMKALEKDRNRRYETANGVASDVQRYLADEPVHACPPSATYRFRKFARRNKATLLTVIVVMAALIGGTTVSTWQAIRATRATRDKEEALTLAKANEQAAKNNADRADAEKRRAEDSAKTADAERKRAEDTSYKARRAVADVVVHAAMGMGKWSAMPIEYRKTIAADALKYYEGLIQTGSAAPAVRYETALALGNVALMHGRFGEYDQAEKLHRRAADVLDALVRDVPKPPEYRQQCAYRHVSLGQILAYVQRANEAEKEYRIAIALYEGLLSESPGRLNLSEELAWAYQSLIEVIAPAPEAQRVYEKMADCAEAACQPFLTKPLAPRPADQARREAGALNSIASCLVKVPTSVERDPQAVIQIARTMIELDPGFNDGWEVLAVGQSLAGDWDAAKATFGESAALAEETYAATPTAEVLKNLLNGYTNLLEWIDPNADPQLRLTELVYRQALKLASGAPADQCADPLVRRQVGHAHRFWAGALHTVGRLDEAEKVLDHSLDVFEKLVTDDPETAANWHYAADTRSWIAAIMAASGREQQAEHVARQSIQRHETRQAKFPNWSLGDTNRDQSYCYNRLAWLLANSRLPQQRNPAEAVKLANKAVKLDPAQSSWRTTLGIAHYRAGQWKDAVDALKKSDELHTVDDAVPFNGFFLAMAYWQLGDKAESRRCYDRAIAWMEKNGLNSQRQKSFLEDFGAEATELLGAGEQYRRAITLFEQHSASASREKASPAASLRRLPKAGGVAAANLPTTAPPTTARFAQVQPALVPTTARPATATTIPESGKWTVNDLDPLNGEAWKLRRDGKVEEAAALRKRVVAEATRLLPPGDIRLVKYLLSYGDVLTGLQRFEEAEEQFRHASTILEQQSAPAAQEQASLAANLDRLRKATGGAAATSPTTAPATPTTSRAGPTAASELLGWGRQSPEGVSRAVQAAVVADSASPSLSPFDRLVYGEHLILGGEPSRAVAAIRQALDDANKTGAVQPFYYKSLGWALLAAGESEQGTAALSNVSGDESRWKAALPPADADPDQWTAAYFLSRVTQEHYTSHFSQTANASFPWFYVGQLMEIQGKRDAAVLAYQKATGLGTHHTRHWAAYRLERLGQLPQSPTTRAATSAK